MDLGIEPHVSRKKTLKGKKVLKGKKASDTSSGLSSSPPPDTAELSDGSFSPTPQAPGAPQTTAVSALSDDPVSQKPQVTTTFSATDTSQTTREVTSSLIPLAIEAPSIPLAPAASRKILEMASRQSPPVPFDKFASSEIFTILVGADLQAFHIHKDLLAGLSDEMRNHVYKDTKEGQEAGMETWHVSPDTVHRFMEFCYSGDYLHAESNSDDPLRDKDATEALPLLLIHAKLYLFADMFNIVSLKELSRKKIIALTSFFGQLEDRAHALAMISLMDYVLQNRPVATETPDKLVKFLARYAGYLIGKLGGYPEFHAVLANSARGDFFKVFCKLVKAGEGEAPWTDTE